MHAHEHVRLAVDVALDQRDVVLVVDQRAVADDLEVAEAGRQRGRDDALDELVVAAAVGDQVGDRDHLQAVLEAVRGEVVGRAPSSRPRSGSRRSRRPGSGRPGARGRPHASVWPVRSSTPPALAFSGCTWPAVTMSLGPLVGSTATCIVCAWSWTLMPVVTPSRASIVTVNGVCVRRLVLGRHQLEAELVAALGRQREADPAAGLARHEVDRVGRDELRPPSRGRPRSRGPRRRRRRPSGRRRCPRAPPRSVANWMLLTRASLIAAPSASRRTWRGCRPPG